MSPWKHRQAQIDGAGVQRVDGVRQFHIENVGSIELACSSNKPVCEIGVDAPIAGLVGVVQRRASNRLAKSHVIELCRLRRQTGLDISQPCPIGELREGNHPELLGAGQRPDSTIAAVAFDEPVESTLRQKIHYLSEQRLA